MKRRNKNLTGRKIMQAFKKCGEVFKKYKVKKIGLFGSYVRNEQCKNSDVDILVEFSKPVGLKFFTLENYLSEMLGVKVELVTKGALKPMFRENILKEVMML